MPYLPALQPQAAPLPPSLSASTAKIALPGLLPTRGPVKDQEEVLVQCRNKTHPRQKAPVQAQSCPCLPELQTIPELGLISGQICRMSSVILLRLQPREPRSAAADLLIYICKLSRLANTDKVTRVGKPSLSEDVSRGCSKICVLPPAVQPWPTSQRLLSGTNPAMP